MSKVGLIPAQVVANNTTRYTAGDALATIPIAEITMEKAKKAGMVRYFGPLMVAKHAPKYLNPGPASSIILTTGSVSEKPIPGWAAVNGYATALHGLNRGLALDLKPIRVNLISPGAVDTDLWAGLPKEAREARFKAFAEHSATGIVGQVSLTNLRVKDETNRHHRSPTWQSRICTP